jgi:outer membrane protein TolC
MRFFKNIIKYGIAFLVFFNLSFAFSKDLPSEEKETPHTLFLSLSDITTLALKNNLDIKIAKLDALISGTDLENSQSIFDTILSLSAYTSEDELDKSTTLLGKKSITTDYDISLEKKFPTGTTLELDLSNERNWSDSPFITTNPSHDASVELSITQELAKNTFGLIDRGTVAMTKLAIKNAELSTVDRIENTIANVQKTYWYLVLAQENVILKKKMLKEARRLYDINKEKFRVGMIEKPDLLASEANVALRETELLIAENQLKNASEDLKLLLNLKTSQAVVPEESLRFWPVSVSFTDSLKEAIMLRRDYARAKNELDRLNINLQMKKNSLWPQVDLEATLKRNGLDADFSQAVQEITSENNPYYYVGLKVKVPLENRSARSNYRKADFEKSKALLKLKKVEEKIAVEIDEKVREVELTKETYLNRVRTAELQQKKLEAELKLFNAGRSSSFRVINYQEDLHLAKFKTLEALYNYRIALINLKLAQNSLLQALGIEIK